MIAMLLRGRTWTNRQQRAIAAAGFALAMAALTGAAAHAGTAMDKVTARSRDMIGPLVTLDADVAVALQERSAVKLARAYEALKERSEAGEALTGDESGACGCDVAVMNLVIAVGFALNKLDGLEPYEPWMKSESLELFADYESYANDCARDAGKERFVSEIRPHHFEAL
jgi:hypothetical protein